MEENGIVHTTTPGSVGNEGKMMGLFLLSFYRATPQKRMH